MFEFDMKKYFPPIKEGDGTFPPDKPIFTDLENAEHVKNEVHILVDRMMKFEQRMHNYFDETIKHLTSDNTLFKSTFAESHRLFMEEVKNEINTFENTVDNAINLFTDSLSGKYDGYLDEVKAELQVFRESVNTLFNSFAQNITNTVDSNYQTMNNSLINYQQTITTQYNTFVNSVNSRIATFTDSLTKSFLTFRDAINSTIQARLNSQDMRINAQDKKISDSEKYLKDNLEPFVYEAIEHLESSGRLEEIIRDIIGEITVPDKLYYTVTNVLNHCLSDNGIAQIENNASYTATLTPSTGYEFIGGSVVVTMDGVDITADVVTLVNSSAVINIPVVTGVLTITATATETEVITPPDEAETFTITHSLTDATITNTATEIVEGQNYTAIIKPADNYYLESVVVTMGGEDISGTAVSITNGTISITSVTGNIEITAVAKIITYAIKKTVNNAIISNTDTIINRSAPYSAQITANAGFELDSVTITMGGVDITATSYKNGYINISAVTGELEITVHAVAIVYDTYSVTYNLDHATSDNMILVVTENDEYKTAITIDDGYELDSVSVTMGGVDITSTVYKDGVITISAVNGDIVITVATVVEEIPLQTFYITPYLSNVSISNKIESILEGGIYTATLTPTNNYAFDSVAVTMGGVDVTAVVYKDGVINIPAVTGDIVITASASAIMYTVTNNLTNATNSNTATKVNQASSYFATISANANHYIKSAVVTMGGVDITDTVYSGGVINIGSVTGNIVITVNAEVITYSVTNNLTNITSSNTATSVERNNSYFAILSPSANHELDGVTVLMGGIDVTSTAYSNGSINISAVTGNIVITATAVELPSEHAITYETDSTGMYGFMPTWGSSGAAPTKINHGEQYYFEWSYGYKNFKTVTVTMGGVDVTENCEINVWDDGGNGNRYHLSIKVPTVTADLHIGIYFNK